MNLEKITARIEKDLEHLKTMTATPGNGCTRLPFTKEVREAGEYLKKIMTEAGLEVWEDAAGSIFGKMKGEDPSLPCVMMGSHHDSVQNGGNYDGIAGVICAIETARLLKESGFKPKRDFVVASFMDEEGMRFGTGYFGSGAMIGTRDVEYCKQFKDKDGISIYDAMKEYGLDPEKIGEAKWEDGSIGYFIELHIEQGRVLENEKIELGLVDCIVGLHRYVVTVNGRADHAGTTPMDIRLDAVDAATKVISKIADWAVERGEGTVATTGYIKTLPGGMNIVAEQVDFSVDVRSKNMANVEYIADQIRSELDLHVGKMGGSYVMDQKLNITPAFLSEEMIEIMEEACKAHGFSYKRMISGAGHDSLEIGKVIPTVMLFVPSKEGRSHTPVEFTESVDFAKGTVILSELAQKMLMK